MEKNKDTSRASVGDWAQGTASQGNCRATERLREMQWQQGVGMELMEVKLQRCWEEHSTHFP